MARSSFVRLASVAGAGLALALVAGCSESEPMPKMPVQTATASPTEPSPTATVDPLAIPEAAKKKTLKGAEAAVRHYFDMYDHALRTGDTKPIKKLYGDYCSICSGYVSLIDLARERGNSMLGRQTLRSTQASSGAKGFAFVTVTYDSTPLREVSPDGKRSLRAPGADGSIRQYNFAYQRGFWELLRIEVPE